MAQISAIICTHNRAGYLEHALASLAAQTLPANEYEVIVVDNACTDATRELVDRQRKRYPNLLYVKEARLGLSWARNSGFRAASTTYVAYLDDDARAESHWLQALLQAFEEVTPQPACIGGRVWLDWGGPAPTWLPSHYRSLYTFLDRGKQGRFLDPHEHLVGANMAFRKAVLEEYGGFDPHLGRQGARLLSGEESALIAQLRARCLPIYYAPDAAVWHSVPAVRQSRRWLLRRCFWDGMSQPLLDLEAPGGRKRADIVSWHRLLFDLKEAAMLLMSTLCLLLMRRHGKAFVRACALAQRWGRVVCESRLLVARSVGC